MLRATPRGNSRSAAILFKLKRGDRGKFIAGCTSNHAQTDTLLNHALLHMFMPIIHFGTNQILLSMLHTQSKSFDIVWKPPREMGELGYRFAFEASMLSEAFVVLFDKLYKLVG